MISSALRTLFLSFAIVFAMLALAAYFPVPGLSLAEEENFFRQRDLLRLFESRGTQGMPYIPTNGPGTNPTPTPIEYFTPMIIVAAIAVAIALIVLLFACFIWWCRCCCKRCCLGDTDPERSFIVWRCIVVALGVLVIAGCFIGLYGGKAVSSALRNTIDAMILSLQNFGFALSELNSVAANAGYNTGDLNNIESLVNQFATYVGLAQKYFTPVDAARLGILYASMTVGLLAAIGLGLGACCRRKEVLTVSFMSCTIAIIIAWITFGINYPLAVTLDDSCVSLSVVLNGTQITVNGISFLIGCLPPALFADINDQSFTAARQLAQAMLAIEQQANSLNPLNFRPTTVDPVAINATYPSIIALGAALNSTILQTDLAVNALPCARNCVNGSNFFQYLNDMRNLTRGVSALITLQDCTDIQRVLDAINSQVCNALVVGCLEVFVGAIVIGSLLIPMGVLGLYLGQKYPNRSPAARIKSRILVIFTFLIFHCLVAVLAEVNASWWELFIVIGTIGVSVLGFLFIIIPMNKFDWRICSQVLLSLFLMCLMLACLAGWIYLFYNAVLNNIACSESVSSLPSLIIQGLGQQIPICNQTSYAHTLIVCIFAGTAMAMTFMGSVLSLYLGLRIACGTPLNLNDSDYELD